jgi:Fe-S cluster assembly protein SufD
LCTGLDSYKLIFVDGVFNPSLSSTALQDTFSVTSLKEAYQGNTEVFNQHYGSLADAKLSMVALNTAFAEEGAFVHVKAGAVVDKLVQILYINSDSTKAIMSQVRNLFVVEDRAEVQILERHQSLSDDYVFTNVVTESSVGNEANFKHFKIQNDLDTTTLVDGTFVKQGAKSSALVDTYSFSGELTRNNLHFEFAGEHAEAHMDAITLLKGATLVDHHTFVDHAVPNCQSNQLYKGIYDEKSKGVFNGKVMVRKDAQKTNAFQQNNNLLLTDFASIDTKPQLEIFADDVACSHGCTIGQLDDEALFYMQSRGIPMKEAKAFLMFAFAGGTLKNITIPQLKEQLINLVAYELKVDLELNEATH